MSSLDSKEALERELSALQVEYRRILTSSSYRLGRTLIEALRSPRAFLRLPLDLFSLAYDQRCRRRPPGPGTEQYESVRSQWLELVEQIYSSTTKEFVFLFSGTTFIQGTRGNRPIRQAQALLARGVPVLFSFHRMRCDESLPAYSADGLVQIPVDITLQLLADIATVDLGSVNKLFVVSYPYKGVEQYIDSFRRNGWRIVYDCRDDWEEFAKIGMARWFDAEVERMVVSSVDRTFCVSSPLVEKMQRLVPGSDAELMPNAVESDFLPAGYCRDSDRSPRVVGYFGHLSAAWFDWEAFAEIALSRPEYQFEVIGHSAPEGLNLPANVTLLGPKPWQELHRYAARWSVAIIPFRMGLLSDGVDPIKIYEYLAFGLPVVSFLMPQISQYPYTTTVDSVVDFCLALDRACKEVPQRKVIDEFIAKNTWEVRVDRLLSVLKDSTS